MSNTTILLVGHGSRDPAGNQDIETFVSRWREQQATWHIEVCYIEFADILIAEGLHRAAAHAQRVIVVPLILNAAGHVKMEIPEHIEHARLHFPDTEFLYVRHLGAEDGILAILKRQLHRAMLQLDMPDPTTTGVIVLGRGASDRMANGEVAKMARWLFEVTDHQQVDIAFTGITYPRLEKVVQQQHRLGMTQIVVLPYYLFSGTLIERIKRQVVHLQQQYPQMRFARSEHFGFEPEIYALLDERVNAAGLPSGTLACDGCKFREFAHDHGAGHSHG
jgi:sirohydrochlorin cobaltochelatase